MLSCRGPSDSAANITLPRGLGRCSPALRWISAVDVHMRDCGVPRLSEARPAGGLEAVVDTAVVLADMDLLMAAGNTSHGQGTPQYTND